MGEKPKRKWFAPGVGARPGYVRNRRDMNRSGPGFPAPLRALPCMETVYIDAGEVGGIKNALDRAREILHRIGENGGGVERSRDREAGRRAGSMCGGI